MAAGFITENDLFMGRECVDRFVLRPVGKICGVDAATLFELEAALSIVRSELRLQCR